MIKRLVFVCLAVVCAQFVKAQYSVGDVFEKDDVKAVVFYVDESGEHGLAITLGDYGNTRWLSFGDIMKAKAKLRKERAAMSDEERRATERNKTHEKNVKRYYAELFDKTTVEGKKNAEIIKQYCLDNDIDMSVYFPAQCWAESLGEGWFVPGEREAILYSNYIANGVGKSAYHGINKQSVLLQQYEEIDQALRSNYGYEELSLYNHINTSTIGRNKLYTKEFFCYKALEPRVEQRKFSFGFSFLWFYDIEAYYQLGKMCSWINKQKVAVYEF